MKTYPRTFTKEEIDSLLASPGKILLQDGRELLITEWSPTVFVEGPVTFVLKGIIVNGEKQ